MTIEHTDYKQLVRQLVLDEDAFVRATMKGRIREHALPWRQVIMRPVQVKGARSVQFSYFTEKQDITKNYRGAEVAEKLDELLALPFTSITVQSTRETMQVQFTKKDRPVVHRTAADTALKPDLSHDARKRLLLPAGKPDAFLIATGIMDEHGQVRPRMQAKFAQINEFLKLLDHTGELRSFAHSPVHILDCGCGSAYLSFAAYHYLNDVLSVPAELVGIDINGTLIEKDSMLSERLGYGAACFTTSSILSYKPEAPPDIVLALHACDTATDEAIYQGITAGASLILCAPCCHHHLHEQLRAAPAASPFAAVFQDGILKKRLADILTDTFRALALRIMGYKTDVVEFIAPEHTDKNLMIRAVKKHEPGNPAYVREYLALKEYWGVTPYIETLLGERLLGWLPAPHLSS
jgi:SAM-dependent methyltransferase